MSSKDIDESSWSLSLPFWATEKDQRIKNWGERLRICEWEGGEIEEDECDHITTSSGSLSSMAQKESINSTENSINSYRQSHGWKGCDLVHSLSSPVRILEYRVKYASDLGGEGTTLTGLVHFTHMAESHRGYCHGGSMCSVMDDAIGWVGFCATGQCRPWTGFTVQVNTNMLKPVKVGQFLIVRATIVKIERRKVHSIAELVDPCPQEDMDGEEHKDRAASTRQECVHARAEGLVIINRGVLPGH